MNPLIKELYRTNHTIEQGCENAGIAIFLDEMLEDLDQCTHCNVWWHQFELFPDDDTNNICKFCTDYYGT